MQYAGITISDEQMAIKIVKQMFLCGHFDEVDITAWERKPVAQKTLANAKTFFIDKYKEKMTYPKKWRGSLGMPIKRKKYQG